MIIETVIMQHALHFHRTRRRPPCSRKTQRRKCSLIQSVNLFFCLSTSVLHCWHWCSHDNLNDNLKLALRLTSSAICKLMLYSTSITFYTASAYADALSQLGGRRFGSWLCSLDFDLSVHYVTTACVLICDWPVGVVSPLAASQSANNESIELTDIAQDIAVKIRH